MVNRFYVLIVFEIGFIEIIYTLVFLKTVRGVHKIAITKAINVYAIIMQKN